MRAFFVDDEAQVLRALRRSFSQADFAAAMEGNAAKGPAAMGDSDLDLLAAEFRMLDIGSCARTWSRMRAYLTAMVGDKRPAIASSSNTL